MRNILNPNWIEIASPKTILTDLFYTMKDSAYKVFPIAMINNIQHPDFSAAFFVYFDENENWNEIKNLRNEFADANIKLCTVIKTPSSRDNHGTFIADHCLNKECVIEASCAESVILDSISLYHFIKDERWFYLPEFLNKMSEWSHEPN